MARGPSLFFPYPTRGVTRFCPDSGSFVRICCNIYCAAHKYIAAQHARIIGGWKQGQGRCPWTPPRGAAPWIPAKGSGPWNPSLGGCEGGVRSGMRRRGVVLSPLSGESTTPLRRIPLRTPPSHPPNGWIPKAAAFGGGSRGAKPPGGFQGKALTFLPSPDCPDHANPVAFQPPARPA